MQKNNNKANIPPAKTICERKLNKVIKPNEISLTKKCGIIAKNMFIKANTIKPKTTTFET